MFPCRLSNTCLVCFSQGEFCSQGVREGLVVSFIKFICQSSRQYCESAGDRGGSTPPALLLLLSRLCLDYETSTISYILTLTDEQFLVQVLNIHYILIKTNSKYTIIHADFSSLNSTTLQSLLLQHFVQRPEKQLRNY